MLIFDRKPGERVRVLVPDGDGGQVEVWVVVVDVGRNQVRLGFDAPRRIEIDREEVVHRRRERT